MSAMSRLLHPVPKPPRQKRKPRTYLPKVNRKRAALRRARDFGSLAEWVVTLPCCISGVRTGEWITLNGVQTQVRVDPFHVRSRGAGGQAPGNLLPVARHLHEEFGTIGRHSFAAKYQIDLEAKALEYAALFAQLFEGECAITRSRNLYHGNRKERE